MREFNIYDEAVEYFKNMFSSLFGDSKINYAISVTLTKYYEVQEFPTPPPGMLCCMFPKLKWVIRDDDLKFADCFFQSSYCGSKYKFFYKRNIHIDFDRYILGCFHAA